MVQKKNYFVIKFFMFVIICFFFLNWIFNTHKKKLLALYKTIEKKTYRQICE